MFLIERGAKLRGRRFQVSNYTLHGIDIRFFFFKKKNKQQHNKYHHSFYPKQLISPKVQYFRPTMRLPLFCINFVHVGKKNCGVFQNALGAYSILPLIESVQFGSYILVYKSLSRCMYGLKAGSVIRLGFLMVSFIVSNIGPGKSIFATSAGTFAKLVLVRTSRCIIQLPSGVTLLVAANFNGVLGRNSGIYSYQQVSGKASNGSLRGRRIIVRSAAKNPVDHPNGGRTRGKMLAKTP